MSVSFKNTVFAFFALSVFGASVSYAASLTGEVVRIADGDTITVKDERGQRHRVRLLGIDAPEKEQHGGKQSQRNLERYLASETVTIIYEKKDQYGRILGTVLLNGGNVNYQQLLEGHAWYYRYYGGDLPHNVQKAYDKAERDARENKRGLWADRNPTAPWDWRRANRH